VNDNIRSDGQQQVDVVTYCADKQSNYDVRVITIRPSCAAEYCLAAAVAAASSVRHRLYLMSLSDTNTHRLSADRVHSKCHAIQQLVYENQHVIAIQCISPT